MAVEAVEGLSCAEAWRLNFGCSGSEGCRIQQQAHEGPESSEENNRIEALGDLEYRAFEARGFCDYGFEASFMACNVFVQLGRLGVGWPSAVF